MKNSIFSLTIGVLVFWGSICFGQLNVNTLTSKVLPENEIVVAGGVGMPGDINAEIAYGFYEQLGAGVTIMIDKGRWNAGIVFHSVVVRETAEIGMIFRMPFLYNSITTESGPKNSWISVAPGIVAQWNVASGICLYTGLNMNIAVSLLSAPLQRTIFSDLYSTHNIPVFRFTVLPTIGARKNITSRASLSVEMWSILNRQEGDIWSILGKQENIIGNSRYGIGVGLSYEL
jgi:hypothetical protein